MATKNNSTRISVTVSRADYEALKGKAEADNRSISNLASKILADYLKNNK